MSFLSRKFGEIQFLTPAAILHFENFQKSSTCQGLFYVERRKNGGKFHYELLTLLGGNIEEIIVDSGAVKGTSQPIIVHSKNKTKPDKTSAA